MAENTEAIKGNYIQEALREDAIFKKYGIEDEQLESAVQHYKLDTDEEILKSL